MAAARLRALDLFCGIGGLGLAAAAWCEVVAAYDQSAAAGATHARNHGLVPRRLDLATVAEGELARHEAEVWLLSPPCQPFTRRGARRDVDDPRCAGLLRLIELIPRLAPRRVVVENVVGFVGSRAHARLLDVLATSRLEVRSFALCPSELGAPVRRPREFVIASRDGLPPEPERTPVAGLPWTALLDPRPDARLWIPEARLVAMAGATARPGEPLATFTRSYGRAIRGAGPVLETAGRLRWFSPEEILRFHGYPGGFSFPAELGLEQRWRLAGNAVHLAAVARVCAALAA